MVYRVRGAMLVIPKTRKEIGAWADRFPIFNERMETGLSNTLVTVEEISLYRLITEDGWELSRRYFRKLEVLQCEENSI